MAPPCVGSFATRFIGLAREPVPAPLRVAPAPMGRQTDLLEETLETANVLELRQKLLYTTPSDQPSRAYRFPARRGLSARCCGCPRRRSRRPGRPSSESSGARPRGPSIGAGLAFSAKPRRATKEGQWVLRTPLRIRTLVFSARHGSKNPGFVLRPLCPYAIASLGVAYLRGGGLGAVAPDLLDEVSARIILTLGTSSRLPH